MDLRKLKVVTFFEREKKPSKGLLAAEWVVMGYLLLTLLLMLFTYTKLHNPESMLYGRIRIVAMTFALWLVYRMWPCRITRFARNVSLLALVESRLKNRVSACPVSIISRNPA